MEEEDFDISVLDTYFDDYWREYSITEEGHDYVYDFEGGLVNGVSQAGV